MIPMKSSQNSMACADHLFMNEWEVIKEFILNHQMVVSCLEVKSLKTWLNYTYTE